MTMKAQEGQTVKPEAEVSEHSDDALAEMADVWAREAEHLGWLARGAHAELRQRMIDRNASKLDTPHWKGTMKPGSIHHTVDNPERFRKRLWPLVTEQEILAAFLQPPMPPMHVDHRGLNELRKQGGEIAAIIDEERRSTRGDPQLVLERKPEA